LLELLVLLQLTQILVLSLILLVITLKPPPNAAKQRRTDVQLMKQRLRAANPLTPDPLKQKHLAQLWNDAVKAAIDADPNRGYWDPSRSIL
jgi:hypothetical protein